MQKPSVKMVRVNERLMHGQGQLWIKSSGVDLVTCASDRVTEDNLQQTLMKTVVPRETDIRFQTIERTAKAVWKAAPNQTILVVVGNLHDVLELCKLGFPVEQLNVKNIHADEGKERISQFIYLGKEDRQALCLVRNNYGVTFNTETSSLSNDSSQYLNVLMGKISN